MHTCQLLQIVRIVQWHRPGTLQCLVKNHFFAFFNSTWCVDEILPGWEVVVSLAFSESKMAAKMTAAYYENLDVFISHVPSAVE